MSEAFDTPLDFADAALVPDDDEALIVDLDGYEGPLHVLLALARRQKVDLVRLSVSRLAEQYLAFVRTARARRFALAADYLVMAAWLAYLKSRLLLPKPEPLAEGAIPAWEIARNLALRLAALDGIRRAAQVLAARPILGRDVFTRGDPEALRIVSHTRLEGDLYQLMTAYVGQRRRQRERLYRPAPSPAYALDDARERLRGLLPGLERWTALHAVAPTAAAGGPTRASCVASTLSASLELVREGAMDARQGAPFGEVYVRARKAAA